MSEHLLVELYSSARDLPPAEFGEAAFATVRKVLPIHSGMFGHGVYHPDGTVTIHSLQRHHVPLERLRERDGLPGADPAILNSLAHTGQTVHTGILGPTRGSSFERYVRRYDVYNAFTLTPGVPLGTLTDGLTMWTGQLKRHVDPARLAGRAHRIFPHLLLANSINRRVNTGETGPASAVAAPDGVLLSASPGAFELLAGAWPDWRPPHLPPAVFAALRACGRFEHGALSVSASVSGGLLLLRLARRAAPALSAAERRVAGLAVAGATYKEIARECGVSPSTVRNQLHAVYAKLGLRNKTELARVLAGA